MTSKCKYRWWVLFFLGWRLVKACEMRPTDYPVLPSHGDLRLCADGLVMIYWGPDGTNIEHMWGTFTGSKKLSNEAEVLCQQLGYYEGKIKHYSSDAQYPVWLSNVNCSSNELRHILRCDYEFNTTTKHDDDWHLTCYKNSTRWGLNSDNNTYYGQVALLALGHNSSSNYSQSLGVVIVKLQISWLFIYSNNGTDFNLNNDDTVCRSMGYTHAVRNSVMTAKQYIAAYNYSLNFTGLDSMSSLPDSSVKCSEFTQCIGCCANLDHQKQQSAHKDNAIVIRCSFYEYNSPPMGGNRSFCGLHNNGSFKMPGVCPAASSEKLDKMIERIIEPAVIGVLLFIILILLIAIFVLFFWRRARVDNPERNPLIQPQQEHH